jgi:hypothetical protein
MTNMYEGLPVVWLVGLAFCAATFLWAAWSTGRAKVAEEAAEEAKASAEASAEAARKALEAASNAQQAKAWGGHLAGQVAALEKRVSELKARPVPEAKPVPAVEPAQHTSQYPAMRPPAFSGVARLPSLFDEGPIEQADLTKAGIAPPGEGSVVPPVKTQAPVVTVSRAGR